MWCSWCVSIQNHTTSIHNILVWWVINSDFLGHHRPVHCTSQFPTWSLPTRAGSSLGVTLHCTGYWWVSWVYRGRQWGHTKWDINDINHSDINSVWRCLEFHLPSVKDSEQVLMQRFLSKFKATATVFLLQDGPKSWPNEKHRSVKVQTVQMYQSGHWPLHRHKLQASTPTTNHNNNWSQGYWRKYVWTSFSSISFSSYNWHWLTRCQNSGAHWRLLKRSKKPNLRLQMTATLPESNSCAVGWPF